MGEARGELLYERSLALRTAWVRIALAVANFPVIWLDHTLPGSGTAGAYLRAYACAAVLLAYAITCVAVLKNARLPLGRYALVTLLADILLIGVLILSTDGYLSPFNLLFVFAVVAACCSPHRHMPLLAAGLGLTAHLLIALVPQASPLDLSVFAVRTGYLFALAAVLSFVSSHLIDQSKWLGAIEALGSQLATAASSEEAIEASLDWLSRVLPVRSARVVDKDHECTSVGEQGLTPWAASSSWPVFDKSGRSYGRLEVIGKWPVTRGQSTFVRVLCQRLAATLRRIELSSELIAAAAAAERVRLADELHDSYLQSLAALDLRAEHATGRAERLDPKLAEDLRDIKRIASDCALEVRNAFEMGRKVASPGPQAIRDVFAARWGGRGEIHIPDRLPLKPAAWKAIEMLVSEGINNARRHARADWVGLYLEFDGHLLRCRLRNNGAPPRLPVRYGYGLMRLRQVVEEQGGRLRLQDGTGEGACLTAEFEVAA